MLLLVNFRAELFPLITVFYHRLSEIKAGNLSIQGQALRSPPALSGISYCRNNVNSPVRTSAIGLLQHLRLLYLPSELDITKYTHNEFTYHLIAIKPQTL
jgi:hypothetical protein